MASQPPSSQQFIEPGPNATQEIPHELSRSMVAEDEQPSSSPSNNMDIATRIIPLGKRQQALDNGHHEPNSMGRVSNKSPKLTQQTSSTATDQPSELPSRKTRVSIRARSDSPMVIVSLKINFIVFPSLSINKL